MTPIHPPLPFLLGAGWLRFVSLSPALGMAPPSSKPSDAVAEAIKRRGKAPLLKLHWNPVPQERLQR
jgi:hypothetical protein